MQPKSKVTVEVDNPATREEKAPLDAVIDQVRADAETRPEAYARETIVPEGGE